MLEKSPESMEFRYECWRAIRGGDAQAPRRPMCEACVRPKRVCICDALPPLKLVPIASTVVLQHRREAERRLGSTTLLQLCIAPDRLAVVRGRNLHALRRCSAWEQATGRGQTPLLLFPGLPGAMNADSIRARVASGVSYFLVAIDGTWEEAREMLRASGVALSRSGSVGGAGGGTQSVELAADIAVLDVGSLTQAESGLFAGCRTPAGPGCLCTLEAVALGLQLLEPEPATGAALADALARPMLRMVGHQTALTAGRQIHRPDRKGYTAGLLQAASAAVTSTFGETACGKADTQCGKDAAREGKAATDKAGTGRETLDAGQHAELQGTSSLVRDAREWHARGERALSLHSLERVVGAASQPGVTSVAAERAGLMRLGREIVAATCGRDGAAGVFDALLRARRAHASTFGVEQREGRGLSVTSRRAIAAGEELLAEAPLLLLTPDGEGRYDASYPIGDRGLARGLLSTLSQHEHEGSLDFNRIVETNAITIQRGGGATSFSVTFLTIARFNHACDNCARFEWCDTRQMGTVTATRYIPAGQEICINYLGGSDGCCRDERQRRLREKFGFVCDCHLCSAPGA